MRDTPPVMVWHVKQIAPCMSMSWWSASWSIGSVDRGIERISTTLMAPNVWRATAHYGFMERPDIPALLAQGAITAARSISTTSPITSGTRRSFAARTGAFRPGRKTVRHDGAQRRPRDRLLQTSVDQVVEIGRHVAI
ncbi:MAG: hypothetical protein U1E81_08400 [Xanthobacteraceae bacterium]